MRFFALDSASLRGTAMADNINVLLQAIDAPASLETIMSQAVRGLQSIDSINGEIKSDMVELKSGDAGLLTYKLMVSAADGSAVPTVIRQYIVLADGKLLVITLGVAEDRAEEYSAIFDDIASRFEVLQ